MNSKTGLIRPKTIRRVDNFFSDEKHCSGVIDIILRMYQRTGFSGFVTKEPCITGFYCKASVLKTFRSPPYWFLLPKNNTFDNCYVLTKHFFQIISAELLACLHNYNLLRRLNYCYFLSCIFCFSELLYLWIIIDYRYNSFYINIFRLKMGLFCREV
jgi:hypothetical protein